MITERREARTGRRCLLALNFSSPDPKTVTNEKASVGGRCYIYNPVHAGGCDEEAIRSVTRGGSVVVLDSGGVYEVEPDGIPDTALWNAGDSVLVCGDAKMIKKDNGEKVHVTPAR